MGKRRYGVLLLGLFAMLMLISACENLSMMGPYDERHVALVGKVVGAANGKPLSRVLVTDLVTQHWVYSDANGDFFFVWGNEVESIKDVIRLRFEKTGYVTTTQEANTGKATYADIRNTPFTMAIGQ
jgi:hypothetical protein